MSQIKSIIFYGYGGRCIGMGHLQRINVLAKTFRKNLPNVVIRIVLPNYHEGVEYIMQESSHYSDIIIVNRSYAESECLPDGFPISDIVIFDCLRNPLRRLKEVKGMSKLVVTIDDNNYGTDNADIAFNPLYWPSGDANRQNNFFGAPAYMPLREEFARYHKSYNIDLVHSRKGKRRVLILQGGADGWNGLSRIVRKLAVLCKDIIAVPIGGSAYIHSCDMLKTIEEVDIEVDFRRNVSNMPELMIDCDVAISGCGVSIFELMCLGIPTIAMTDEEKELETATRLSELGCVLNMGRICDINEASIDIALHRILDDRNIRNSLSARSIEQVDGLGANRIADMIEKCFYKLNR